MPYLAKSQGHMGHGSVSDVPDLENIEHIMLKKYNKKLKAKVKATTAHIDRKGKPKKGTSGGGSSG
jgi:hypothetical protein